MKLSRHNGRSGKNGAYNVKHNDRRFDVEKSEHIDAEMTKKNIYWDCYQGYYSKVLIPEGEEMPASFSDVERQSIIEQLQKAKAKSQAENEARQKEKKEHPERFIKKPKRNEPEL